MAKYKATDFNRLIIRNSAWARNHFIVQVYDWKIDHTFRVRWPGMPTDTKPKRIADFHTVLLDTEIFVEQPRIVPPTAFDSGKMVDEL